MSRKSQKHKLTRNKFKNVMCQKCGLCPPKVTPKFCYNFLYKSNPGVFQSKIFPNMMGNRDLLVQIKEMAVHDGTDFIASAVVRNIFCGANICSNCKTDKESVASCLAWFRFQDTSHAKYALVRQAFGPKPPKKGEIMGKRRKKKKKKIIKVVPPPTVTVFMSDNEEFKAEVRKIIENNSKQPDKDT